MYVYVHVHRQLLTFTPTRRFIVFAECKKRDEWKQHPGARQRIYTFYILEVTADWIQEVGVATMSVATVGVAVVGGAIVTLPVGLKASSSPPPSSFM